MHVLITGEPKSGKTTLLFDTLRAQRKSFAGFITREMRWQGERMGFKMINLATGKDFILSSVDPVDDGLSRVGKYFVNAYGVQAFVCPAIQKVVEDNRPLVFDEIGEMQLLAGEPFTRAILCAFDRETPTLATVHLKDHPFTDALKQRSDVQVVCLTAENRGSVARELQAFLYANF